MEPRHDASGFRAAMGLFGLAAGLALWALSEFVLDVLGQPRLELALVSVCLAYFVPALLLSGPMTMPRALLWALVPGVCAPLLLLWASLRFEDLTGMSSTPQPFLAFFALVVVSLPYLVALQRGEALNYIILFNEAWRIVIRAVASALFVGVFWGVYMMSNLLLSLVGLETLDLLLDRPSFGFGATGLVVGLALSVLYEQRAYLSPVLLMRLFQLLLIPVTLVVVVFVARVPFQGLDQAFSGLSAAATLMTMTLGLATLISAALDCDFGDSVPSRLVLVSVQVAALLMPVLAVLAGYAIWARVSEYGWTPERVAASLICVLCLAYAMGYAASVLLRGDWHRRIRRTNIWIGLGVLGMSALSLTPGLNPERISAQNQVARYEAGRSSAENLPLFEMANLWGVAGRAALVRLEANADAEMSRMLADLRSVPGPGDARSEPIEDQRAVLARLMPLRPEGAQWPSRFFEDLPDQYVSDWLLACRRGVGRCAGVVSDSLPEFPGAEVHVMIWTEFDDIEGYLVLREPRGDLALRPLVSRETGDPERVLRAILDGEFAVVPPRIPALRVGEQEFLSLPR
ncbi:hypothetical protein [Tropicimonas sp. S265A]|uniref:hypothetical protein n=1 Tax=Tropicimonas sp. S265A TaxID=3415134 RepID=UPI003C7D014F